MFPAATRVPVWSAVLGAGDVVLIPALWWHYIKHLPGASIAVSFCQHRTVGRELQPFAASYERHFARRRGSTSTASSGSGGGVEATAGGQACEEE